MAGSRESNKARALRIAKLFEIFQAADPAPDTELKYLNPYTLLVAIVLSAQATDVGVNKATKDLFPVADTPQKMIALGEAALRGHIRSINFHPTKAKNVIALSRILVEQYDGDIPHAMEALMALPGVGRKTASVWRNNVLRLPTIAVDTHVFRVSHRLRIADGKTPDQVQAQLEARIPEPYLLHAHHWLILHGRYVCVARNPKCHHCIVETLCPKWGVTQVAPGSSKKPASPTARTARPLRGRKKPDAAA